VSQIHISGLALPCRYLFIAFRLIASLIWPDLVLFAKHLFVAAKPSGEPFFSRLALVSAEEDLAASFSRLARQCVLCAAREHPAG
jgi:hypothetical protein